MADAEAAREQARAILSERRFQEPEVPRPFETPLDWLGDRVEELGGWLAERFAGINGALPGGAWVVWILLALLMSVVGFLAARSIAVRRAAGAFERSRTAATAGEDPVALERAAEAAERAGRWEEAVRLRFRAGVLRLDAEASTTGEIAARLDSPDFTRVGATHDAIAYGGAPATAADAEAARAGWRAALR